MNCKVMEAVKGSRKSKFKEAAIYGNSYDLKMGPKDSMNSQTKSRSRVLFTLLLNMNVAGKF